jgi:Rad3-related DNA helicase
MSGGHFDYNQYRLHEMADEIERLISRNGKEPDEWQEWWKYEYTKETINEFEKAVKLLRYAAVYVQRIDWFVSGDDSEESFHSRLNEELKNLSK